MSVRHDVTLAKDSDRIHGRAARRYKSLIQAGTPVVVLILKVIGVGNDANPILLRRELELNAFKLWEFLTFEGKSSERQARDTTGLGVYSCRPDLPFVRAF
jgi:hypothetical protein